MDKKAYWLWLREALGAGAVTDEITAVFPSPEEMYSKGEIEWRLSGVLTNKQIERLRQCSPEKAQGIVDVCRENGWSILTPDDEDYPQKLRNLRNMPLSLFVKGDIKRVTRAYASRCRHAEGVVSGQLSRASAMPRRLAYAGSLRGLGRGDGH